jgi:hypothetical protein
MQNKPKIIRGICEFCGVPAKECMHYKETVDNEGILLPNSPDFKENSEHFNRVTPYNCRKNSKKILIGCVDFSNLTGMPMYLYNLGKEMIKRGYEISLVSTIGGDIARLAREAGFKLFDWEADYKDDYMAMLLNEPISARLMAQFPDVPAYNIIHSARPADEPIADCPQIRKYFYSKDSDLEYMKGKVPVEKIESLPIPIDFERFNPAKKREHERYTILAPCTFDDLRRPMLLNLVQRAIDNPEILVILKGKNYGVINNPDALPANVKILDPSDNVEDFMAEADEVAGILLGTVTLEAWAMGLKTSVYDLEGNFEMVEAPIAFEAMHKSSSVAYRLDTILNEKWADIIIPHHDQPDLLAQTLKTIPIRNYNVIIVRGSYFSKSCNKGARLAETNKLIFANDDMAIGAKALWEMIDNPADVVGVRQVYPDGTDLGIGIFINEFGNYELTARTDKARYPSGALFRIKRNCWEDVGGLNEEFFNGGEDQDLFLRCLEAKQSVGFVETPVIHYCSQSTGRFDYIEHNDNLLFGLWPDERLQKVLGNDYRQESDVAKKV